MKKNIPNTQTRVEENTAEQINRRLRKELEARIFYYAEHTEFIDDRLIELEKEWDIERILETNAAGVSLFGIVMASRNRKWLILPFAVAGFLMQHALQGWCPPIPVFRRLGIRTTSEINAEKNALKALRGDFGNVLSKKQPERKVQAALEAVNT